MCTNLLIFATPTNSTHTVKSACDLKPLFTDQFLHWGRRARLCAVLPITLIDTRLPLPPLVDGHSHQAPPASLRPMEKLAPS